MADIAHELTDRELEKMERHLSAIYARAEKELAEKADKYFKRFEELDAKKRELVEAGKLTEQDYKRWRQNKIMTGRHWTEMKEQTAQELLNANRTAQAYINGQLPGVYTLNYNRTAEGISEAVKGYSFELVDASTVKNLATSDKTLLPYKYVDGKKDVRWNTQKVNSEVLQGILQGDSIPHLAKRLQNVTEMNRASAIRNARTTVTSAENKGRMDSLHRAAEKGVITHKVWLAAIDARTREAHRLLDGQEQEIDDPFESELGDIMFPGDPDADPANVYNCRCTLIYKVVGFENRTVTDQEKSETAEEFTPAHSIEEAEQKAGQIFDLPESKIDYKNVNISVANEINRTAEQIIEKYPELNNIAWVQSGNGKEFVSMHNASFTQNWEMVGNALEIGRSAQNVGLEEIQKKIEHLADIGWTTKGADFSRIIWHEFGHAYASYADGEFFKLKNPNYLTDEGAFLRYLRDDKKTFYSSVIKEAKAIAKEEGGKFVVSNISQYATKAKGEMFAEAFAEYNTSTNPTNESRWIMEATFKLLGL